MHMAGTLIPPKMNFLEVLIHYIAVQQKDDNSRLFSLLDLTINIQESSKLFNIYFGSFQGK